jgi:hypothetical protein
MLFQTGKHIFFSKDVFLELVEHAHFSNSHSWNRQINLFFIFNLIDQPRD